MKNINLDLIHNAHARYMSKFCWNTIADLKEGVNRLSEEIQQEICKIGCLYLFGESDIKKLKEYWHNNKIVQVVFDKLDDISKICPERFVVYGFVQSILASYVNSVDNQIVEKQYKENKEFIQNTIANLEEIKSRVENETGEKMSDEEVENIIKSMEMPISQFKLTYRSRKFTYEEFCDKVVVNLISKDLTR